MPYMHIPSDKPCYNLHQQRRSLSICEHFLISRLVYCCFKGIPTLYNEISAKELYVWCKEAQIVAFNWLVMCFLTIRPEEGLSSWFTG